MSSTDGNGWLNLNQMSSGSALKRPSDGWHDDLQEKLHFPAKRQRRAAAEGLCQWKKKWRRNLWFRIQNTKQVSSSPDKELESFAAQSDGGGTQNAERVTFWSVVHLLTLMDTAPTQVAPSLLNRKKNYNNVFVYKRMRVKFDASLHSPLICITNSWNCNPPPPKI